MRVSSIKLLKKRVFLPLFLTQFFGAFNDNAFKFAMLTLISYHLSASQVQSERYQAIAGALYILPFFFFSATAGQLADKFNKATLVWFIKLFELLLVSIGGVAFYYGSTSFLLVTLMGMGVHSTFFGPIKYSILLDHLPANQLLGATALIEASTFLAILLGTILGTLSVSGVNVGSFYAIILTGIAALVGLFASWFIPPTVSKVPDLQVDWNVGRATHQMLWDVFRNSRIVPVIFAISWFWLVGAVILTKLPDYTNYVLRADTAVFAVFLSLFSIGIALGSLAINRLLGGKSTLHYVPHAMFLMSLFAADLYWISPVNIEAIPLQTIATFFNTVNHWRIAVDLGLLAFSGGLFVVPLYTYLQVVSEVSTRSRTIAANNIINALFMVFGTCLVMVLLHFQLSIANVFLILAVLNVVAVYVFLGLCRKARLD